MASVRLQPPTSFDFKNPDSWPKWKKRFEQFRLASGLAEDAEEKQVSTLLYCMGDDAEETLTSTGISDEQRKKYADVIGKFDNFFKVRKNVIYERARFNRRSQGPEESVEQFITSLYSLAEDCAYGALRDEMIRDRIVVGIRDASLSERLQLDSELTLEKAKTLVRQREAVHEQQALLRSSPKQELAVDEVKHKPTRGGASYWTTVNGSQPGNKGPHQSSSNVQPPGSRTCFRCGKGPHPRRTCPARDALCHTCGKKGHFRAQCRSKPVADITASASAEYDMSYLNTVDSDHPGAPWITSILVNGQEISFKLDTGAEVTVISEKALECLGPQELQSSSKRLHGPDNRPLHVMGELSATLSCKGRSSVHPVYVVRKLQQNLLGLPAIQSLNLLAQVDAIGKPIPDQYPDIFTGLGTFPLSYTIKLKPDAQPHALFTPRNVPLPLRKTVQAELARMVSLGVISRVDRPTQWCAGMVVVPKKAGSIRICVDFRRLNESVLRETHPLPRVDNTLAQLTGATVFSKIDANSGFWQVPLEETSKELTTFITPFGRYHFNRLPFGITSAPEHFQRQMESILAGMEGVLCHMDDVLIFGRTQQEHDARLHTVLQRIQAAGVTLNKEKCQFNKDCLTFLGHVIDKDGVSPDPLKTAAIERMEKPRTTTELRRFMGMVNQLGKFTPTIAEISQPLRELLSSKTAWVWGPPQDEAFKRIKTELTQPTVLALYSPDSSLKVSADASSYGLGAVLLQQEGNALWRPVAYASRSMSKTEQRYSQIEKEALAIVWACERFADYIVGKPVQLETDHKPLVPLLTTTHLDRMPPRVLRFRLRLTRFEYIIKHVPGKLLYIADALSRAPNIAEVQTEEYPDTEFLVQAVVAYLPASSDRLQDYRDAQKADPVCSQVMCYCKNGWPNKHEVKGEIARYWIVRGQITIGSDLLLYDSRIIIPKCLQAQTLKKIHHGHQGIQKCRQRASTAVWWPGVSQDIEKMIKSCPVCQKTLTPPREPLLQSTLPACPWERVASDLFDLNGKTYVLVVDYYSRYIEVMQLKATNAVDVISALKSIFSRHGIPAVLMSDNGPQYGSEAMEEFAKAYNFTHIMSSPGYPQANGEAERAVQTAKGLLKDSPDPYLALLSYRATPLPWCGLSPAQLLMGRHLRTDVPQWEKNLIPNWPHLANFSKADTELKARQKSGYDKRHRVRELPALPDKLPVWVQNNGRQVPGEITQKAIAPRSYLVETPTGELRRNRSHIRVRLEKEPVSESTASPPTPRVIATRSRTGTTIHPPDRLSQST